jgi:phosphohistidine swiveling domain-containing protein
VSPAPFGPRPLADLDEHEINRFGAKAVNLGRMARAGLPVPEGFALAKELSAEDIRAAYRRLGEDVPVAVRSSAVGEDGEDASFAGQHDTYLGVQGADAVVDAVRRCMTSVNSDRARAYREQRGAALGGIGVVVQVMVDARMAGVCFTRSPLAEGEIVVEAVRGLGEALVSGRKRPARVSFTREELSLVAREDPERLLDERGEGIARLCLELEQLFGVALDIEWACDEVGVWLLQARPITATTLDAQRDAIRAREIERLRSHAGDAIVVWSDFSIADMLPRPSPMVMDLFARMTLHEGGVGRAYRELGMRYSRQTYTRRLFDTICGRAVLNVSDFVRATIEEFPLRVDADALSSGRSFDPASPPLRVDWRDVGGLALFPVWIVRWLVAVPRRFFALRRSFHASFTREIGPRLHQEAARLRTQEPSALSNEELLALISSHVERVTKELIFHHQLSDAFAFGTHMLLARYLRILYGDAAVDVEVELTTGLEGNFNTESNLDMARVAAGQLELDTFLERYGQRGSPDWDPAAPRWREQPEQVEAMVAMLEAAGVDPVAAFEAQARRRVAAEERLHEDVGRSLRLRPWRRAVMRELRHYQRYSPLRETTQACCYLWIELLRSALLELGHRSGAGELVFHMKVDELAGLLAGGRPSQAIELARTRRHEQALARGICVPHVLRSDRLELIGQPPELDPEATELVGETACTGVVSGTARVVTDLDQARALARGEILVTATTDPSWTPLFLIAGGLVLEQGGMLSHGAIVAREHGLPAVINVEGATRTIRDGQAITLDASAGRVLLGPPPP